MNIVDAVVLLLVGVYASAGYRSGLLSGALSIGGFIAGAVAGAKVAPTVSGNLTGANGSAHYPVGLVVLILGAVLGQIVGASMARRLRTRLTWSPARTANSVLGAALSCLGVLFVVWILALPLASSPVPAVSREVRQSRIVHAVDAVVPDPVRSAYSTVRALAGRNGFPAVLGSLQATHINDVAPPDTAAVKSAAIARAQPSIVKVLAGGSCASGSEGSGFLYAAGRVMTNAHVVAGMSRVSVRLNGADLPARVVLFDAARDVAVLAIPATPTVPTKAVPPLEFAMAPARQGSSAVAAGYPGDGPFAVSPARIRDREQVTGYTIYDQSDGGRQVTREIYAIRARVRPGNSGGPLLDPHGAVLGIVFARALDSSDTGFVLTAHEVAPDARAGRTASASRSTGSCLSD